MEYSVIRDSDARALFTSEDRPAAFTKARELEAGNPGEIYVEDSDGRVYEDLNEF